MEAAYSRGLPLPDFIADAPMLLPGLELYYDAFQELSTDRSFIGMDGVAGPIPWTAIDRYAERIGCDDEEAEYLRWMVRGLDDEFLEHVRKKNAKPGAIQQKDRTDRDRRGGGG